jgi:hypothetical protein
MHNTSSTTSVGGRGWLLPRRALPSYLRETNRRYQRSNVSGPERLAPELPRRYGQPTSLGVGVAQATTPKLLSDHCVLSEQIFRDALVVAGHPPGDDQQQELQWQARHGAIVAASLAHRKPPRFQCDPRLAQDEVNVIGRGAL